MQTKGQRVRLTGLMKNENSAWKPVEDLEVGSEGVILYHNRGYLAQLMVKWDNGIRLALLPEFDEFEVLNDA
jgi:hypothetical protein